MTQPMILMPADAYEKIIAEIRDLKGKIDGATITPRPEWVSVPVAAKAKGVTPATVRRWINEGRIEARGVGKAREVRLD